MPRNISHREGKLKAKSKRDYALQRQELRGSSEERRAAAGPTSLAVKVNPDADLIEAFLERQKLNPVKKRPLPGHRKDRPKGTLWKVYALVDPRDEKPFYIGCSIDPHKRCREHHNDPGSAAWIRVMELRSIQKWPTLKIIAEFDDEQTALIFESEKIEATPGLVNRQKGEWLRR